MRVSFCGNRKVHERRTVEKWLHEVCVKLISEGSECFFLVDMGNLICANVSRRAKYENPAPFFAGKERSGAGYSVHQNTILLWM